jgi:integrase
MIQPYEGIMSIRKRAWTTSKGEQREAWIVDYTDQAGERHIETFAKKKDADAQHDKLRQDVRHGVHISTKLTVAQAGAKWIEHAELGVDRDGPLERATIKGYREALKLHIEPMIGKMPIAKLDTEAVRNFEKRLIAEKRSRAKIKSVLGSLSSILADAGAPRNAVRDRPRKNKNGKRDERPLKVGVDIPTPAEVSAILHHAPDRWRALLVTAAFTGLRASELRGLHWEDVDLKKNELHVTQRADCFRVLGSPKSKTSHRTVPFGPVVANTLRPGYLKAGGKGLAFPTGAGTIVDHSSLVKASIIPASKAAGVPQYTGLHCLRHFYASWCIDRNLPPKVIQTRMGHSSITMTFDRYGHLFPKGDDAGEIAAAEQAIWDATQTRHGG